jgi:hypothetical protein
MEPIQDSDPDMLVNVCCLGFGAIRITILVVGRARVLMLSDLLIRREDRVDAIDCESCVDCGPPVQGRQRRVGVCHSKFARIRFERIVMAGAIGSITGG